MKSTDVRDDQIPAGAGSAKEVAPIAAASVILVRSSPLEVLLMRRHEKSSFVPGAWVFPGGIVEDVDRIADELTAMKRCAVRELCEEAGIPLDAESLVCTARWITPVGVPKRFDTWFFVAESPSGAEARPDETEVVEVLWLTPREALERHERGELALVFPTIKNLEALAEHRSAADLIEARRGAVVKTMRPILVIEGDKKRIALPDE